MSLGEGNPRVPQLLCPEAQEGSTGQVAQAVGGPSVILEVPLRLSTLVLRSCLRPVCLGLPLPLTKTRLEQPSASPRVLKLSDSGRPPSGPAEPQKLASLLSPPLHSQVGGSR